MIARTTGLGESNEDMSVRSALCFSCISVDSLQRYGLGPSHNTLHPSLLMPFLLKAIPTLSLTKSLTECVGVAQEKAVLS